jgi:transcriptional regulator with XRE-family HTH domain
MDLTLMSPEEVSKELGARLRRERLRQNLTQHTLAERAGVSRVTVARMEATGTATLQNFVAMITALHRAGDLERVLIAPEARTIGQFLADEQPARRRGRR